MASGCKTQFLLDLTCRPSKKGGTVMAGTKDLAMHAIMMREKVNIQRQAALGPICSLALTMESQ